MVMNFLVMPLYFLSGAMFPVSSTPGWMKTLMTIDPLTYGVDALRIIVFSATTPSGSTASVLDKTSKGELVHWNLPINALILVLVGILFMSLAAARFSRADNT
jgi:ABC-2 type transport system permease protein